MLAAAASLLPGALLAPELAALQARLQSLHAPAGGLGERQCGAWGVGARLGAMEQSSMR
jgi:hypothetical protein